MSLSKSSVCDIFDNLAFFGKSLDKLAPGAGPSENGRIGFINF